MQNSIFYCPFEYYYSQVDDKTLVIGALFYSEIEKKIIFECDKIKAKSIFHTHYPKIKFEIIEAYIDLIYQNVEKKQPKFIYNKKDFKKHIDDFIFSPDDSALRFGKIKYYNNTKDLKKIIEHYENENNILNVIKNKFDYLFEKYFENQYKIFVQKNKLLPNTNLKIDRIIGSEQQKNIIFFINFKTQNKKIINILKNEIQFSLLEFNSYQIDFWINANNNQKNQIRIDIEKKFEEFSPMPNVYFAEQWTEYAKKYTEKYLNTMKAKIFYFSLTDEMKKEEKLEWFRSNDFENIPFERIRPDKNANWINLSESDFEELIPVCSKDVKLGKDGNAIFELFTNGVVTARDEWVYDILPKNLEAKIQFFINIFNKQVATKKYDNNSLDYTIKWSESMKNILKKGKNLSFKKKHICKDIYRPYIALWYYYDKNLSDRLTNNHFQIFGEFGEIKTNPVIMFSGISHSKPFQTLSTNTIYSIDTLEKTQGLPLYRYSENGERKENITDWALDLFQSNYKDKKITKLSIFHYVYAVLHNPEYRKKYEIDLKRDFPRIPFYKDFWQYAEAGEKLMDLHLNYENLSVDKNIKINRLPLESLLPKRKKSETSQEEDAELLKKIKPDIKLKSRDGIIEIDELTTISNIPAEVWEYKLGNRSAVDWVLDQYKPYKSGDETIQAQFNEYDFFEYKEQVIDLLLKVIFVSVETMKIVKGL